MRALVLICAIFFLQGCGSILNTGANVCDGLNTIKPIKIQSESQITDEGPAPAQANKRGEKSLLLYRMLNTI
jgi:uncharacterized protein YceK